MKRKEAMEYPTPTCVRKLRSFLGLSGWNWQYIAHYATKTAALTDGLKNDRRWEWTEEKDSEFEGMKGELRDIKALLLPDFDREFMLKTDACDVGLGAELLQKDVEGDWRPVAHDSKKLTRTELRYWICEKEMYAVFWWIKSFEYELRGRGFWLVTDDKALEEIRGSCI